LEILTCEGLLLVTPAEEDNMLSKDREAVAAVEKQWRINKSKQFSAWLLLQL
jgi:hypothetical protein